ncbi:MAG: helix-turn-helix domain-containing protein [Planctomycetota bacterium]|jgi:AraC-like DNA-binding protein
MQGLSKEQFTRIQRAYLQAWPIQLIATAMDGKVTLGDQCCTQVTSGSCQGWRKHAISEALRWGEATVCPCPAGHLLWAVPIMHNSIALGGLIAIAPEERCLPAEGATQAEIDTRKACSQLRLLAEAENITNADYHLKMRGEYAREQKRAYVLHDLKTPSYGTIRDAYLQEEPALISAIRGGDRSKARQCLNNILLAIYGVGQGKLMLLKSFVMELVVSMCRTAVEMGGEAESLLGANYMSLSELSHIRSEEALSSWLVEMLERIMDSIQKHKHNPSASIGIALQYIRDHFREEICRADVASACHLSESHFSRLFKKCTGMGFTETLNTTRVNHARELLARTSTPLLQVALLSGFQDQSYFCKVFRRHTGTSPRAYRRSLE